MTDRIFTNERHRDRLTRSMPLALVILALVLVVAAAYGFLSDTSADSGVADAAVMEADPNKSTDRSQWMRGKMPYLYQTDREWAEVPYADATIANSGCGPTCLSMVYVYLTGKKDRDPVVMAELAERGGYIEDGNTRWAFMTSGARSIGLNSQELPADEGAIRAQLEAGHPVIVSVMPGDFTTKGHFIVLESIDSFGRILIRDPNSPERSGQAWELSRIISQARNFWAFSI